jgi:hypothetical protein
VYSGNNGIVAVHTQLNHSYMFLVCSILRLLLVVADTEGFSKTSYRTTQRV